MFDSKCVHNEPMIRLCATAVLVFYGSISAADTVEFNRDIRPILAETCFKCHGADSGSREADLRLDERDAAISSGAIVPGNLSESQLLQRIFSDDPDLVMPPPESKIVLTEQQKDQLKSWIADGAEYEAHWSLIAPERPEVPQVQQNEWVRNPLDAFVLAGLQAAGLEPAPAADARTLFRRMHLDVTGLPPSPADSDAFVAEFAVNDDGAVDRWITRLMERPSWGEHRARYWLDAARYADTHGLHFDNYREMYPYRDWVIGSFNSNQPFDQFTVEQLAGDLLPQPTQDQLVATGFQRCNITTNEGGTIDEENLANYAVDRVQTFGWVYLGLTTNCAQCHDHKFDPLTARDFYSLAAYFRNTTQGPKDGNVKDGRGPSIKVIPAADRERWEAIPNELEAAMSARDARRQAAADEWKAWAAALTAESLQNSLPAAGLALHVPLTEGQGKQATAVVVEEGVEKISTVSADLTYRRDGPLGAAPIIRGGQTFSFGAAGNYEKTDSFSYGCWVQTNGNTNAAIIARMDEASKHRGWDLWQNGSGFAVHVIDSWPDNGLKVATADGVVKPGQWQHVFVTISGTGTPDSVRIFVDGQQQSLRTLTNTLRPDASIRAATAFRIGQRSQAAVLNDGAIQDVRIYDRELTAAEVQAIRNASVLLPVVSTPFEQRTEQQEKQLREHYLNNLDQDYRQLTAKVDQLNAEKTAIDARSPVTHIQQEKTDSEAMAYVLMRGAYDRKGDQVTAATPVALHPQPANARPDRLGLAEWVVAAENPLTARVTVNRFWQEVFGLGIVATAEDFGIMGAPPSNPELLDWLAVEFRESGWDVQHLFRLMLSSSTYRQAALTTPQKLEADRDNVLLSRGPRFRMDAEMVRDYALSVSGLLSETMYGPGTRPYQPEGIWDVVGLPGGDTRSYVQDKGDNLYRRTIYNFWKRMAPPPGLEAFNAPSREVCTVRRERTNTPLQALVTLNDVQFVEAARVLAQNALRTHGNDLPSVINLISRQVLCRSLSEPERQVVMASYAELKEFYSDAANAAAELVSIGEAELEQDLDTAALAAWTMVCNQLMNLDEVLSK